MKNSATTFACSRWKNGFRGFKQVLSFVAIGILSTSTSTKQEMFVGRISVPDLPPAKGEQVQYGLAGPVAGCYKNYMLVAGGANFGDKLPWRGGTKKYHDDIYLLENSGEDNYRWIGSEQKLPLKLAYPACVSTSLGIVCVGGENETGMLADAFLITLTNGKANFGKLPSLPEPVSSAGPCAIGSKIFVAGGLNGQQASSSLYCLDLQNLVSGWVKLQNLPVSLSHAVVAAQSDGKETCVFVLGGRNKTSEITTFYSTIWKYSPTKGTWIKAGDIAPEGNPLALSAGTGHAFGNNYIALIGGDPGIRFNKTERLNSAIEKTSGEEKQKLVAQKDFLLTNHPGFEKDILVYETTSGKWTIVQHSLESLPVTTTAFMWDEKIIIPSGEIRPGIRTAKVLGIKINQNKELKK